MHRNGRNGLPAARGSCPVAFSPKSASGLELLNLLEIARRRTEEVARRLDVLVQLRGANPASRMALASVVRRALAFEESLAGLMIAIEGPQKTPLDGRRRL